MDENGAGARTSKAAATRGKPTVAIIHQLARTGGTLLNRCLGSMANIVVLSEVHPLDQRQKLLRQARRWFHLLRPWEAAWLKRPWPADPSVRFARAVALVERRCRASGRHLVLRDWTHIDFIGVGVPFFVQPSRLLMTRQALATRMEVRSLCVVRHPIDQYLSSKARRGMRSMTLDEFVAGYVTFAEQAREVGYVRYEDFVARPDEVLTSICDRLGLPFDPSYRERWSSYLLVTGDVRQRHVSRGFDLGAIAVLPRRACDEELVRTFRHRRGMWDAAALLGYEP